MSPEILRRAASLMRERASSAINSGGGQPWYPAGDLHDLIGGGSRNASDAEHIASWDPLVALAVADWLEGVWSEADLFPDEAHPDDCHCHAHTVARAYLGEPA